MKIVLVSDFLPYIHNTWSGAELVCWKLGKLLEKENYDVKYITLKDSQKTNSENIFFVRSLFSKQQFIGKNFILDIVAFISIFSILKKIKPDIVHIHAKLLFFPVAISALILNIPYFFTVLDYYILCPRNILLRPNGELCNYNHGPHCDDCFCLSEREAIKVAIRFLPRAFKKILCIMRKYSVDYFMNKAFKIITFSQASKNRLLKYGYPRDKIEIIYHYQFETTNYEPALNKRQDGKKILFVGSLTEHKGLHIIIEAMNEVVLQLPDVKLLVVGKGNDNYTNYINKLIKEHSVEKHIDFLGHKNNEDVIKLIKEVDIVVVPEQWYSEFGPVILIEAKLSGKPVVASSIGSIPEYIRDGVDGILVTYNRSEEFSKSIIKLLKDPSLIHSMGESISENIYNVTKTEEMLARLERLYTKSIK